MPSAGFPPSLRVPVSSVRFADTAYKSSIPDLNSDASYDRTSGRMMHRYCFVHLDSLPCYCVRAIPLQVDLSVA